jgi:hypothetical protein
MIVGWLTGPSAKACQAAIDRDHKALHKMELERVPSIREGSHEEGLLSLARFASM